MGCCFSGFCSNVDPEDPTVTAYILTTGYHQTMGMFSSRYSCCCVPRPVYVREDNLYFDCFQFQGYPLTSISKIDILGVNVRIYGSDGTVIGFTTSSYHTDETDRFVSRLQAAVDAAKSR